MPSDKPLVRLADILENIDKIETYIEGHDFQSFARDPQCRDATEHCLLRIAEAAAKLKGIVDQIAPDQPWSNIRALGNRIRHEYDTVSPVVIWQIVTEDLSGLRVTVQRAMKRLQSGDETNEKPR